MRRTTLVLLVYMVLLGLTLGILYLNNIGNFASYICFSLLVGIAVIVGFIHGNHQRHGISTAQMVSFKHEANNALMILTQEEASDQHKFNRTVKLTEAITLFQIVSKPEWPEVKIWSVKDTLDYTFDTYRRYAANHGVNVIVELDYSSPVKVNREGLNIAMRILLSNSVGVTPKGGTVRIYGSSDEQKRYYTIFITDAGGGVPSTVVSSFANRVVRSKTKRHGKLTDIHGERRYGNGLNMLTRLLSKVSFNVQLHAKKQHSVSIQIPLV